MNLQDKITNSPNLYFWLLLTGAIISFILSSYLCTVLGKILCLISFFLLCAFTVLVLVYGLISSIRLSMFMRKYTQHIKKTLGIKDFTFFRIKKEKIDEIKEKQDRNNQNYISNLSKQLHKTFIEEIKRCETDIPIDDLVIEYNPALPNSQEGGLYNAVRVGMNIKINQGLLQYVITSDFLFDAYEHRKLGWNGIKKLLRFFEKNSKTEITGLDADLVIRLTGFVPELAEYRIHFIMQFVISHEMAHILINAFHEETHNIERFNNFCRFIISNLQLIKNPAWSSLFEIECCQNWSHEFLADYLALRMLLVLYVGIERPILKFIMRFFWLSQNRKKYPNLSKIPITDAFLSHPPDFTRALSISKIFDQFLKPEDIEREMRIADMFFALHRRT